jgi:uncharacterized repeat protein (TIGR01451 family)
MDWKHLPRITHRFSVWSHSVAMSLKRRLVWALIYALVLSFLPWTPPSLTSAAERAFQDAPASVMWAAPLALSVTGWTDEALSAVGLTPVYASENITLTMFKRDDGDALGYPLGVGPDPVHPGEAFLYYIHVTNTGTITATVMVTEFLPAGLTCGGNPGAVPGYEGGPNTNWGGYCADGVAAIFTLDYIGVPNAGLPAGRNSVLSILAIVQETLPNGYVFTNTANSYLVHDKADPSDIYTGTNDVTTTVSAAELMILKSATPDPVKAGEQVTFTLAISNSGSYTLTAPFTLTVVDNLPMGTNYVTQTPFPNTTQVVDTGAAVTWTVPFTSGGNADLAPGEILTASLVVTVDVPFTHTYPVTNADHHQERAICSRNHRSGLDVLDYGHQRRWRPGQRR